MRVSWSYTWRIHYVGKSPRERVISSVRIIKNARAPNNSCPLYTVILRTNTPVLDISFYEHCCHFGNGRRSLDVSSAISRFQQQFERSSHIVVFFVCDLARNKCSPYQSN